MAKKVKYSRNQAIWDFRMNSGGEPRTYQEVADRFRISKQRAWSIVARFRAKKGAASQFSSTSNSTSKSLYAWPGRRPGS